MDCPIERDFYTREWIDGFFTERCLSCQGFIWIFPNDPPFRINEEIIHATGQELEAAQNGDLSAISQVVKSLWKNCSSYVPPRKMILHLQKIQADLELWRGLFEAEGMNDLLSGVELRVRDEEPRLAPTEIQVIHRVPCPPFDKDAEKLITLQKIGAGLIIAVSEWLSIGQSGLFYWDFSNGLTRLRGASKCAKLAPHFWREETATHINILFTRLADDGDVICEVLLTFECPKRDYLHLTHQQLGENHLIYFTQPHPPYTIFYHYYTPQGHQLDSWESETGSTHLCLAEGLVSLNEIEAEGTYHLTLRDVITGSIRARSQILSEEQKRDQVLFSDSRGLCYSTPKRGRGRRWTREGDELHWTSEEIFPVYDATPEPSLPDAYVNYLKNRPVNFSQTYKHITPWSMTIFAQSLEDPSYTIKEAKAPNEMTYLFDTDGLWISYDHKAALLRPSTKSARWIDLPFRASCISVSIDHRLHLRSIDNPQRHIWISEDQILGEYICKNLVQEGEFFLIQSDTEWLLI